MDLDELRAVVELAEAGSLLRAAESLGLSRTTLRRRLEALEARVGVPIFSRDQGRAVLTPAGRLLADRGREMVQEAGRLLRAAREMGRAPTGQLRVLLPIGLPPHALTPLFAASRALQPRLALWVSFHADPLARLLEDRDEVDVAFHFGALDPPGPWVCRTLVTVREWLIASTRYLERRGTPRTLDDLAGHTLLAWEGPGNDPHQWPLLGGDHFAVEPALITPHIHWLRQCALEGLGIALVPDGRLPDPGVPAGTLQTVLVDQVGRMRTLRMAAPAATAATPKLRMVLDVIDGWVRQQPPLAQSR